jgi:hypothetical protein
VASVSFDDVAKVYQDGTRAVSGFDLAISDGVTRTSVSADSRPPHPRDTHTTLIREA